MYFKRESKFFSLKLGLNFLLAFIVPTALCFGGLIAGVAAACSGIFFVLIMVHLIVNDAAEADEGEGDEEDPDEEA
jgi:uncharacterized membrane protein YtjA (UPF0391 family)